jgi:hypothetical protein
MLVHRDVNLKLQNSGVEDAIRQLHRMVADPGGAVLVSVAVTSHPRTAGNPQLLREASYRVSVRHPDGTVKVAFEVDIGEIGLPGTRSAADPPVSVTLRELAHRHPELADLLE